MKIFGLSILLVLSCSFYGAYAQDTTTKAEKKEKIKAVKPYIVHDKSFKVTRVDVRKDMKGAKNVIQIDASNSAGGTGIMATQTVLPPAVITNVNIVNGSYNQTRDMAKTARGMSLQLLDVVFPCRIRVSILDQMVDVEITEPGFWKVTIALAN
ncbi:hypothetical protein [Daejeonella lutea]|uniref:Uncharacterized protein n=1 Tax=Daejeonella lutea TaxID=572036 RepID=A0A1T5ERD5_9SPHI|nr:hypothetical protein [Daejeonella lutea]SKB86484.1 hypothetical protein SAMN05661099_3156 [Daejeonella lutea]